ncbi:hypothetical protein D3C81_1647800 [compost metagenome]
MQREGDLPLARHLVDRRFARGVEPALRDALAQRLGLYRGVVRIEEHVELRLVQVALIGHRRGLLDAVGVVQHHAEVTDAADAGLGADRGLAGLDARIAEQAFLGLAALPVEIDLLVRAARDAHAPAAALVLVDQHDAVVLALVDRARGA